MPTPVLGAKCLCGAYHAEPCDMFVPGEALAAMARLAALGWGYDERGFVLCASCMRRPREPIREEAPPAVAEVETRQLSLGLA